MHAKDLMVKDVEFVRQSTPLLEAVERMRRTSLVTGQVDMRVLLVEPDDGATDPSAFQMLTEADVIRSILPRIFREKRFSDYVGKWLASDLPSASLHELWSDLARGARKKKVKDVLTADAKLVSVGPEDSLLKVAYLMHTERIKSVPVVDGGRVVGIVFRTAVFEAIAKEIVKPAEGEA